MSRRRTLLYDLQQQGRDDEAQRILSAAIVESRGVSLRAAHLVDCSRRHFYRWLDTYPSLWPALNGARQLRRAPPKWLAKTIAALEAGRMSVFEQILQVAQEMTAEEIAAEFDASVHAGSCDSMQLAQAIAAAALSFGEAG